MPWVLRWETPGPEEIHGHLATTHHGGEPMSIRQSGTYVELDDAWNDPGWSRVPNSIARCPTVSRRFKGWVLEVASHEKGRRLTFKDMVGCSTDGRDATYAAIKEGVDAGFVTRHQERDDSGRLGVVVYRLHVTPQNTRSEPLPECPDPVEPFTVAPDPVNPETSKKTNRSLKDQKSKELVNAVASTDHAPQLELVAPPPSASKAGVKPAKDDTADAFDQFWKIYPRKVAKQAARRSWDRVVRSVSPAVIIRGAARYAREQAPPDRAQFTKHPATWLNGGCWDDEPAPEPVQVGRGGRVNPADLPATDWRRFSEQ